MPKHKLKSNHIKLHTLIFESKEISGDTWELRLPGGHILSREEGKGVETQLIYIMCKPDIYSTKEEIELKNNIIKSFVSSNFSIEELTTDQGYTLSFLFISKKDYVGEDIVEYEVIHIPTQTVSRSWYYPRKDTMQEIEDDKQETTNEVIKSLERNKNYFYTMYKDRSKHP